MKTTIDIPEKELADAMKFTGAKTKREAVVKVIEDFNRRKKMAELIQYSGTFTDMMTNEEIEGMELKRMKRNFGAKFEFNRPEAIQRRVRRKKK